MENMKDKLHQLISKIRTHTKKIKHLEEQSQSPVDWYELITSLIMRVEDLEDKCIYKFKEKK